MLSKSVSKDSIYHFKNQIKKDSLNGNKVMLILLILLYLISTMFLITVRTAFEYSNVIFILRGIYIFGLIVVLFCLPSAFFSNTYKISA